MKQTNGESTQDREAHGQFKIKSVADLTGFSPTLLRAWERRYDFLDPERHSGGHRLYSKEDLAILERIKQLLDEGRSIGEVAALGRERLLADIIQGTQLADGILEKAVLPPQPQVNRRPPETLRDVVMRLAPSVLKSQLSGRYRGEEISVSVEALAEEDRATLEELYELVRGAYELWLYMDEDSDSELLIKQVARLAEPRFQEKMSRFGEPTTCQEILVQAALSAVRCGALGPLTHYAQVFSRGQAGAREVLTAILLARDHAKMLRNAFHDLDQPLREADERSKAHGLPAFVRKIHRIRWNGVKVRAATGYQGPVTSRCLETSALDRVLYDFLGRATGDGSNPARLWVVELPTGLLRWVFELESQFEAYSQEDFSPLVIGKSVGLGPEAALSQGYIGSRQMASRHWAWFHWPVYHLGAGDHLCDCDSLLE